jgi:hypothetical protein
MNKLVDDTQCIAEWRKLLKTFELIIKGNPKPESVKVDLDALKDAAKNSANLTFHQVTAIQARCDNYMNGEYGNSKKPEHYSQEHNFSTNGKQSA